MLSISAMLGATKTGEFYDIMNAVRTGASEGYRQYIPLVNADNFTETLGKFQAQPRLQNEFLNEVVNKIVLYMIRGVEAYNPLERFRKASSRYGDTEEELYVGLRPEEQYDYYGNSANDLFSTSAPDVRAAYHTINRRSKYTVTIFDTQLNQAFVSAEGIENLLSRILDSLGQSNIRDEYMYTRLAIEAAYARGGMYPVQVGAVTDAASATGLVRKAREYAMKARFINKYTEAGVEASAAADKLSFIAPVGVQASVDVDVLANAFNMSKAEFLGQQLFVDQWGDPNLVAVMIADDFLHVVEKNRSTENFRDPSKMATKYFLHIWQTIFTSPFHVAIAFVKEIPDTAKVRGFVTPNESVLSKTGKVTETLQSSLLASDGVDDSGVTWTYTWASSSTDVVVAALSGDATKATATVQPSALPGSLVTITMTATPDEGSTGFVPVTATATLQIQA
jgi:hypothetical protein